LEVVLKGSSHRDPSNIRSTDGPQCPTQLEPWNSHFNRGDSGFGGKQTCHNVMAYFNQQAYCGPICLLRRITKTMMLYLYLWLDCKLSATKRTVAAQYSADNASLGRSVRNQCNSPTSGTLQPEQPVSGPETTTRSTQVEVSEQSRNYNYIQQIIYTPNFRVRTVFKPWSTVQ